MIAAKRGTVHYTTRNEKKVSQVVKNKKTAFGYKLSSPIQSFTNSENLLNKINSQTANIEIRGSFNSGLTSSAGDYTNAQNGPE